MLILIVGITGNIGLKLADALIQRGHNVRGASRTKSKLLDEKLEQLESFHQTSAWYDVKTLRQAVKGVDAVVCSYSPVPELALEGELLLVRIMEEEGVTRFVPSTWNLDWSRLQWGAAPYYDVFIALQRQLALSSTIKPLYLFTGIFAEVFFSISGHGGFAPKNHGVWDPDPTNRRAVIWGSGNEKWQITTEHDCAEFTAEVVTDLTKESGYFRFCSFAHSTREMVTIYEGIRRVPIKLVHAGSLDDLRSDANAAVREMGLKRFWDWMGYFYQVYQLDGTFFMRELDNKLYPSVKPTSLEEFLKENIQV